MSDSELQRLKRRWQADPGDAQLRDDFARALRRSGLQPHYALIACIESNLEALTAVLEDIDKKGISDILCLGGVVGSGPNPVEVIDLVRKRCRVCLVGLKDRLLLTEDHWFRRIAVLGKWVRGLLEPSLFSGAKRRARWKFLNDRPIQHEEEGVLFVHGSPRGPDEQISARDVTTGNGEGLSPKLEAVFGLVESLLFNALTHIQGVTTSDNEHFSGAELNYHYEIRPNGPKLIINVGSVGQPRDNDTRAGYVERIGPHIFFHRVPYDLEKTIAKIKANKHIDGALGECLREGI
ncbi:MAG: metallophosphoesterase [Planctomycetota bacterium]|nr:metallophosphoesterase [Planctomycetota bacterium]